ncbi:MAG: methylenetetrahydrofolate reductase [NAD(P)H] [Zoogloeaceae bacterium]|jgi:methylenetetrahydrofolate reductase (NADPH)|nr:methylenetetrahydrofolate reductase [NAD(P)H] [Zoogloeaceae bacterium]
MKPNFSIEFFPPQTLEGVKKLKVERARLARLKPEFFSVTYGAGGSTRERTFSVAREIAAEGHLAVPHLSCVGASRADIRAMLAEFKAARIQRLVALRGDLSSGMADRGELRYANELVEFIRAETGDWFHIDVAAYPEWHPQAKSPSDDLQNFVRKVRAGANGAITQYFYNADAYFRFVEEVRKLGVEVPIVPGVMPINNFSRLARFSDACGAEIPRWLRKKIESCGDDSASIQAYGVEVVSDLCRRLLQNGAPGLHFYSMNLSALIARILEQIDLARGA